MASHSEAQRAECRRAYEAGETLLAISKRTGIDRKTLRVWRDREGWTPQQIPQMGSAEILQMREQTRSNVIAFSTGKAMELVAQSGVIEAQADLIAENLTLHGQIGNLALRAVEQTFAAYNNGAIKPGVNQNQADVLQSVLRAAKLGIDMTRDVAGLKSGQISAQANKDKGRASILELVIVDGPAEELEQAS